MAESPANTNELKSNYVNCALTPDNNFFVGVFATNNYVPSSLSITTANTATGINSIVNHPFNCYGTGTCF